MLDAKFRIINNFKYMYKINMHINDKIIFFRTFAMLSNIIFFIIIFSSPIISTINAQVNSNDNIGSTYYLDSKPYGLSYGEWTAKWWQWVYSISSNTNPAYDNNGKYCTLNQTTPVWFLAGTFGYPVVRECTIPTGVSILFPVLNSECSYAEHSALSTEKQLRECVKTMQDKVLYTKASLDGIGLDLTKSRIQSPLFTLTLSKNNILGLAPQTTNAVSDGNWVFLKPLTPGKHVIHFIGDIVKSNKTNDSFAGPVGWNYETVYELTVDPNASINTTIKMTKPISNLEIKDYLASLKNKTFERTYVELTNSDIKDALNTLHGWTANNNKLHKTFGFRDFPTMFSFLFKVAEAAMIDNHHPNMTTTFTTATIDLDTWSLGHVISNEDKKMAEIIENIYQKEYNKSS